MERDVVDVDRAARFVVGIDLGTTNSAVTYVDTEESNWRIRVFEVPQLVAPGQVERRETLPSFHYEPAEGEFAESTLRLPWSDRDEPYFVGVLARDHGALVPGRLIASAKSWLCHTGVDRTAELLPWHGSGDVEHLSPITVSSRYLAHLRAAWNHRFPEAPLEIQDLVITLPASFDEVARELTVKAAAEAGLPRVFLIEEPQSAFYSWIDAHAEHWESLVTAGQKILVCDIGGGTTDFTLIRVRSEQDGRIQFHRVAVGEHLILGGDNLDLAVAQFLERRLVDQRGGEELTPRQWSVLVRISRQVKETLLGPRAPETYRVALPGSGSRLVGGGLQVDVTAAEIQQLLLEGFLPRVDFDESPRRAQSGFQEFGLPFAADHAMTRYLSAFLRAHASAAETADEGAEDVGHTSRLAARPDVVLFNGGLFDSPLMRQRLIEVLKDWFAGTPTDGSWSPHELANERLDLAVARGAAYYGMVRRGAAVRIAAGLARTYYLGVGTATDSDRETAQQPGTQALCIVSAEAEPGQETVLDEYDFQLRVSEPVEFPLFVSSTRLTDQPGSLVEVDPEQMKALPPLRTVLKTRKAADSSVVQVSIHARLTEIGTLELWCTERQGNRSWRLQFDIRSATQTDVKAHTGQGEQRGVVEESTLDGCRTLIRETFGPRGQAAPEGLVKRLSRAIEQSRHDWPTTLMRSLWEALMDFEKGRRKSAAHEVRWLNLLGFVLRPGYGVALDDWRVTETWKLLQNRVCFANPANRAELLVLWRRIAGGLTSGQQQQLANPLLAGVRQLHRQLTTGKGKAKSGNPHEAAETWRLLASLERLPLRTKSELGEMALEILPKKKMEALQGPLIWAVGRLGARALMHGPLNAVLPVATVLPWLQALCHSSHDDSVAQLAVMQLARRTRDRYRDIPSEAREDAVQWLRQCEAPEHFVELVEHGGQLASDEQKLVFGDSLPVGLRIGV